jgi:hypothetical protein
MPPRARTASSDRSCGQDLDRVLRHLELMSVGRPDPNHVHREPQFSRSIPGRATNHAQSFARLEHLSITNKSAGDILALL